MSRNQILPAITYTRAGIPHVEGCPPFFVDTGPTMDSETAKRFDRLEEKLDQNHTAVMQKFHGERGDNGLFGRVQTLEERDAAREKAEERHYQHQRWRWNIAASSGAVGLTTGVWSLLKAYFGAKQ